MQLMLKLNLLNANVQIRLSKEQSRAIQKTKADASILVQSLVMKVASSLNGLMKPDLVRRNVRWRNSRYSRSLDFECVCLCLGSVDKLDKSDSESTAMRKSLPLCVRVI